jgi:16S rRNA (cytidine1402-2'-O)-methyltransferase
MSTLYIVSTPIGNLGDITDRAKRVLAEADLLFAEDTRTTRTLLAHCGINRAVASYHEHNERRIAPAIVAALTEGRSVALVSDAGTPGIADAAFLVVREALRAGVPVVPVPGACAAIAALVGSGLPADRFVFENFLPPKSGKRRTVLERLKLETRTVIVYESPHRIASTLEDMRVVLGDIQIVIGRELTKLHEEFLRGTAEQLAEHFRARPPLGEMVVLFNPRVTALSPAEDTPADASA